MFFYGPPRGSNSWTSIGTKKDLCAVLASLTRIDPWILNFELPLESVSIAARMSWAAGRDTTRVEDRAYSLIGIFGVNMPMMYGEGDRAFIRLQEEILKRSTDQSVLLRSSRDVRFTSSDEQFAHSPDEFRKLSDVIQWKNAASNVPFRVTCLGVETYVKLIEHGDPARGRKFYGVLNCRYSEDLEGPLTLFLEEKTEEDSETTEDGISRRFSLYHRTSQDGRDARCFQVVPLESATKAPWQIITILKPNVVDFQHTSWGWKSLPRIWFRPNEQAKSHCTVAGKYPQQAWNESVFYPNIRSNWEPGVGCMEWKDGDSSTMETFVLAFKLRNPKDACAVAVFRSNQVPEYHQNQDLEALRKAIERIFHRSKGFEDDGERRRFSNSKISPTRRRASAGRKVVVMARLDGWKDVLVEADCLERMGELVWILRMSISDATGGNLEPNNSLADFSRRLSLGLSRTTSNQDIVYWSSS